MTLTFTPAKRSAAKARIALPGPSGSGKTYTGLTLACALGEKVAVIDTERGRASMYVGLNGWSFDTANPTSFSPTSLTDALGAAAGAGYDAVLVDSLSHYWSGIDGMQEQADRRARGGNSFSGWKEARPDERRMFDALASYPGHVIVTLRTKTSYVIEQVERNGRTTNVPRKIGLKPDQREGIEYEYDLIGDMDMENTMTVSKSRIPMLSGQVIEKPGPELAATIKDWLADGEDTPGPLLYRAEALDPDATYDGLRELYGQVETAGLLGAPVTDHGGAPTVLGDLIKARGQALKAPATNGAQA
jgi:hypothetical protein